MTRITDYETLKFFKEDYDFRTKRERDDYFRDTILDDGERYKQEFTEYLFERLHVFFTWHFTLKWAGLAILIAAFFATNLTATLWVTGTAVLVIGGAYLVKFFMDRFHQGIIFTLSFMEMEGYMDYAVKVAEEDLEESRGNR